jgi:gamma-glutamylcysteine synthetase
MGRSVDYLNRATNVAYFQWPTLWIYNEETGIDEESDQYEDGYIVTENIQESIISDFPEYEYSKKWDGRETSIILTGYRTEIGLSEYCGLATLSIRIDENELDYSNYDENEYNQQYDKIEAWINENWAKISQGYNQYNKIGTFSNGESVYEKNNK